MPLTEYGVAIGSFVRFWRDNPDAYGKYLHGHVVIRIPNGSGGFKEMEAAVDVNKPAGDIEYFHPTKLDTTVFTPISSQVDGYHALARDEFSGALDYKRSKLIGLPLGCLIVFLVFWNWLTGGKLQAWTTNVGTDALNHLEGMFAAPGMIAKVYLFGEPFPIPHGSIPDGLHDVHCNQGDPPGQFQRLDGIWQDGGVIVKYTDEHLEGFFVKFATQTLNTNDLGLPA